MNAVPFVNQTPKQILDLIHSQCPLNTDEICDAVPLPGTETEGYSAIYRNKKATGGLISVPHPSVRTVKDVFDLATAVYPKAPCLGTKHKAPDGKLLPYKWESYEEIHRAALNFGAGVFFVLNNNPFVTESECHRKISQHKSVVANSEMSFVMTLYSHNTREWCIADLACASYSITNTALYDTLGPESTEYILSLTESCVVLCTRDKAETLINLKKQHSSLSNLISLIIMEPLSDDDASLVSLAREQKITLHSFAQVTELGALCPTPTVAPTPQTVYTISFTSGTTLAPKGVVLTHENAVASSVFVLSNYTGTTQARYYCFLPLAHIYGRMGLIFAYLFACSVGMPQSPSPLTLLEDIKELEPNSLALVPRVHLRFESAIKAATIDNKEKPLLAKLFRSAINKKMELMEQHDGATGKHFFADVMAGLLRKKLGMKRLLTLGSGSAPLAPESIKFLKAALNVGFSQGYGLTESFAGICGSQFYEAEPGSCGPITVTCEAKLRDIPDMNYSSRDPEGPAGELMLRGPQIFREYYKNPTETAKAKDEDGWFSTGDVARFHPKNGRIYIVDRIKNFFKLAQGEYITPEKIENTYMSAVSKLAQIYVHGDSYNTYLVGIVGVEVNTIQPWLKYRFKKTVNTPEEVEAVMNEKEVKKLFLKEMNAATKGALQGFERLHNIKIAVEPLKAEDGVLTPTMKVKRESASKVFAETLKELYREGSLIRETEAKL